MGLLGWLVGIDALTTIAQAIEDEANEQYDKGYADGLQAGHNDDMYNGLGNGICDEEEQIDN